MKTKIQDDLDEREICKWAVKKFNTNPSYNFELLSEHWCDVGDILHKIFMEYKTDSWEQGAGQLLYSAFRKFGHLGANKMAEMIAYLGLGDKREARFYKLPSYQQMKAFFESVDPTGKTIPSSVKSKEFIEQALLILGTPVHINIYEKKSLDLNIEFVYITTANIRKLMRDRLMPHDIDVRQLITNIADVQSKNDKILIEKHGRMITDNVNRSELIIEGKRIKEEEEDFFKSLRVKPKDLKELAKHFDEYEHITKRRNYGKFYTSEYLSDRIHDVILKHVNPGFILEPYAGTGSLCNPFKTTPGLLNDINAEDIELAKAEFEDSPWETDNIDVISLSAEELIERWGLRKRWTENSIIYSNPPFGAVSTGRKLVEKKLGKKDTQKIKIKYRDELLKYGSGDLILPTIGQKIEILKHLGKGYLAFFCPMGVFCGRKRYNSLLKELLSNFTFVEGLILYGNEFNNVIKEKPIAFTIWKFGGSTKHLNMAFDFYGKKIKLSKGNLLKDGWKNDNRDGINGELRVSPKEYFFHSAPSMMHSKLQGGGSRIIPENVKKDISFIIEKEKFPSEIIYALWNTIVGYEPIGNAVAFYTPFGAAYTHIPTDFTKPDNQKILTYSILWTLINELNHHYTSDNIGFPNGKFRFGTPKQTKAVKDLIIKYAAEPCLDTTVLDTFNNLKLKAKGKWAGDKELRADLKKRLSALLDKIHYWDKIIVPEVLTDQELVNKNFRQK